MRIAALMALLLAATSPAQSKKDKDADKTPVVLFGAPLAVPPGATTKVKLRGLKLDGVTEIKCQSTGASAKLVGKAGGANAPEKELKPLYGDAVVEAEFTLKDDVAGEFLAFTAVGPAGESKPARLLIGRAKPLAEKEPNDGFAGAQSAPLPADVDAKIQSAQDVDVYRVDLPAGQSVTAEVFAARLGAPIDPRLTVYDARGQVIDATDDSNGTRDPKLLFTATAAGPYFVAVSDAHDRGGSDTHLYRLVLRAGR